VLKADAEKGQGREEGQDLEKSRDFPQTSGVPQPLVADASPEQRARPLLVSPGMGSPPLR
jgi:hypothetical protein